jgi:hypothetical protein
MSTQDLRIWPSIPTTDVFEIDDKVTDGVLKLVGRLFTCWHLKLTRPITRGNESYRACLRCGMHRRFDLKTWKSIGRFYSPSVERRSYQ